MGTVNQSERKATFCEQKVAKKLYYAGPGALSRTQPMAQRKQKFLRRFFQKAATFLKETPA
ncbi:MAG TPA: hypothetical protein VNC39_05965 [Acidocella sp.]|jgi:hypothetical protein|uniref:hypothetical protein n=1 Tax=Acidocella sp. TaxID=50710 RepID=UPI002CB21AAF|nr:hypothetical protein [Acidocella sp.]HVE21504.1 hypothetical protein [Acidocella sp.]